VAGKVTVRVDELVIPGVRITLEGLSDVVEPGRVRDAVRETVPEKPLMLFTLIVDVPVCPAFTVRLVGLAVIAKVGEM
jgi:hypothetical protein